MGLFSFGALLYFVDAAQVMGICAQAQRTIFGLQKACSRCFGALGRRIASSCTSALVTMFICSLACFGGLSGLTRQTVQSASDELWVPQDTLSRLSDKWVKEVYKDSIIRRQDFLIIADSNALTKKVFDQIWELDMMVRELADGETKFADVCTKVGSNCLMNGALGFWGFDKAVYDATVHDDADLLAALSSKTYLDGGAVDRSSLFSQDLVLEGDKVKSAKCVRQQYFSDETTSAIQWEKSALNQLPAKISKLALTGFVTHYLFQDSVDLELAKSVAGDISLVASGYTLMCLYTAFVLLKCSLTKNRGGVSIMGVVSVFLGIFTGFGVCAYLGIPFTSLTATLPFILLGIGIGDMFIIMSALDDVVKQRIESIPQGRLTMDDIPNIMAVTLSESGVACTVTSLSDLAAFLLGSLTRIPAVEWFCIYAAISVTIVFIMQFTFLAAFISLDLRRQAVDRADIFCCVQCKPEGSTVEDVEKSTASNTDSEDESNTTLAKRSLCDRGLAKYGECLGNTQVKVVVFVIIVGWCAASLYMMLNLKQDLPLEDLATTDSYVRPYFKAIDEYYVTIYGFGIYHQGLDFTKRETSDRIIALTQEVQEDPFVRDGADDFNSWIVDFRGWCKRFGLGDSNGVLEGANFTTELQDYLGVSPYSLQPYGKSWAGLSHNSSIVWNDEGGMKAAVVRMKYVDLSDDDRGPAMISVRKTINESKHSWPWESENVKGLPESQPHQFQYSRFQIYWEQDLIMISEPLQNFLLASAAVFVIVLVLLAHIVPAVLAFACIAMINADLMGLMYLFQININSISVICLVMSIGLAVDYTAHYLYAFMTTKGESGNARLRNSMTFIGMPVFSGGFTTFLGVAPLAFSKSVIFFTFFRMFCGIIFFGLLHGLVFAPIVISVLNPAGIEDDTSDGTVDRRLGDVEMTVKPAPDNEARVNPEVDEVTY